MSLETKNLLLKAQDTKEKLCILALDSYLNVGAHQTHFQGLANTLGISQAAIYKHFKNKEDLLVHAINYAAIKGREYLDSVNTSEMDPILKLKTYVTRNFDFCLKKKLYSGALITLHYFATCVPEVKELHADINNRRRLKIDSLLTDIGILEISKRKELTEIIHSILMGEMIKTVLWPDESTSIERSTRVMDQISKLL